MAHKLLLADDSPTIQRVVELTFANEDIDVVAVGDGAQAIEAIERDAPDIVLADVSMPGKDGYEVASFVRLDPARARIPVVLLTGAFEPLDTSRCDALGRPAVLVKPFEPREVIGKVRALLELPAAGAAKAPAVAAASVEQATGSSGGAASNETAADPGAAPAAAASEAPAGDDVESAAASVVDEADGKTTDPGPATAAVGAAAEEESAEQAVAGASDSPPASDDEDAATPDEHAVEDEAVAPPAGDATAGEPAWEPPAARGGSVLAQSFVTFLAVEQGAAPPALRAAGAAADSDAEPLLPEAVMNDLVGRVVERLTDTVLRDTVAEVVSRLAERLARGEISRVPPGRE